MVPPLLAAVAKPVPIWMCFGILDVGDGRMREDEVLKADGRSICNGQQHFTRKCSGTTDRFIAGLYSTAWPFGTIIYEWKGKRLGSK